MFGCPRLEDSFDFYFLGRESTVQFHNESKMIICYFERSNGHHQPCRFELSYKSIWNIELHKARKLHYLLVQFLHVPRFYVNGIRITDITKELFNSVASGICFSFDPVNDHSVYFRKTFPSFEEFQDLYLTHVSSPAEFPPQNSNLSDRVSFKIQSLIQHGCLSRQVLAKPFLDLVEDESRDEAIILRALDGIFQMFCNNPMGWRKKYYYNPQAFLIEYYNDNPIQASSAVSISSVVCVCKVLITPCKMYFCGPEPNASNRILRQYANYIDNFLRVTFVDEDFSPLYSQQLCITFDVHKRTRIGARMFDIMKQGITINRKKFEFLAFSTSQVRNSSLWMFAPTRDGSITAPIIREKMGDFSHIKNVAKFAARLGLSFSSSTEALTIGEEEIEEIPDIERNGYTFSDGIGKISPECAKFVEKACGYEALRPSAFQIRYSGYKGVVAIDPSLTKFKLSLRRSMNKFTSKNRTLDVLGCARYRPMHLNRQLITLLSTLGIEDEVFLRKQQEAIEIVESMIGSDGLNEIFDVISDGVEITVILKELINVFDPSSEPFFNMMINVLKESLRLKIESKSRILIPKGNYLMGCLDESGTLEYGQVFIQRCKIPFGGQSEDSSPSYIPEVIKGKVVVSRSPCLHPGDVRVLTAIDVPDLHHMLNCVVFPQKGSRPHPDECSGGDLDGDMYGVCWDEDLIPPTTSDPMEYTPATTVLEHDVNMEDIYNFFVNFKILNNEGQISNAHAAWADQLPQKAKAPTCLELAKLFSVAVDQAKTGVPAVLKPHLRPKKWPDFLGDKPGRFVYESGNVLGKLFRASAYDDHSQLKSTSESSHVDEMKVGGYELYVDKALREKGIYDEKLNDIMNHYKKVKLLTSTNDNHGGVIVEMDQPMDSTTFGKKGVWIKVPIHLVSLVEALVKEGFWYHHAEPKYLMLVYWIPETPNTIPANATHRVGVGAFVMNMNEKQEVLVVQENSGFFQGTGVWKFPTGVVDQEVPMVYGEFKLEVEGSNLIDIRCRE
ncbi:hypothetical protein RIF29_40875 [Crotalaria pallida]|uniref:RNA-dependent RNA polymerase n=1 Tax=Crotalaria pallida TaxID=3830 RepID=A0AAN9HUP8_CROPI